MSIPVVSLPSTAPSTSKRPADCEYDDPYGDSVSEEECDNEDYDMDTYEEVKCIRILDKLGFKNIVEDFMFLVLNYMYWYNF